MRSKTKGGILVLLLAAAFVGLFALRERPPEPRGAETLSVNGAALSLGDVPPEDLSGLEDLPLLEESNQLLLSYLDGAYPRQGQVLVRAAYEEAGAVCTSPMALIHNFSEGEPAAEFLLRDLLDLDHAHDYTLVQFELISY